MKRMEAYRILAKMWNDATPEQDEAIDIAMDAIEFVDLMPDDTVAVVRCKDCAFAVDGVNGLVCYHFEEYTKSNAFCSYGERKDGDA